VKISVTQEHIDQGVPNRPCICPIGLAFRAAGFDVSVTYRDLDFFEPRPGGLFLGRLATPSAVKAFQVAFDKGEPVSPFEFEMPGLRLPLHESQFTDHVSSPVV
jgi:hypothetical protein